MSILSLIVYGSRARDDHSESSDTDLFAITDDQRYEMVVRGSTNIACYPIKLALSRAATGDLFFMHITHEGKAIYDPENVFAQVKENFVRKNDYSFEIKNACELGYALIENMDRIQDYYLLNKRLAWCLRTVLIAKSAELGRPTFSKEGLAELFEDPRIVNLVSLKGSEDYTPKAYPVFYSIFTKCGVSPNRDMPSDYEDLMVYFSERDNAMGLKTARLLSHDVEFEGYDWA